MSTIAFNAVLLSFSKHMSCPNHSSSPTPQVLESGRERVGGGWWGGWEVPSSSEKGNRGGGITTEVQCNRSSCAAASKAYKCTVQWCVGMRKFLATGQARVEARRWYARRQPSPSPLPVFTSTIQRHRQHAFRPPIVATSIPPGHM